MKTLGKFLGILAFAIGVTAALASTPSAFVDQIVSQGREGIPASCSGLQDVEETNCDAQETSGTECTIEATGNFAKKTGCSLGLYIDDSTMD